MTLKMYAIGSPETLRVEIAKKLCLFENNLDQLLHFKNIYRLKLNFVFVFKSQKIFFPRVTKFWHNCMAYHILLETIDNFFISYGSDSEHKTKKNESHIPYLLVKNTGFDNKTSLI